MNLLFYCRKVGENTYKATTWQIIFQLKSVNTNGNYTLRLALASANDAELQVIMNNLVFTCSSSSFFTFTLFYCIEVKYINVYM